MIIMQQLCRMSSYPWLVTYLELIAWQNGKARRKTRFARGRKEKNNSIAPRNFLKYIFFPAKSGEKFRRVERESNSYVGPKPSIIEQSDSR